MNLDNKIIKALTSGNFSIVYTDNEECQLYLRKDADLEDLKNDFIAEFNGSDNGYTPVIVEYLVKALGGSTASY